MGFDAVAQMMPDRPQEFLALERSKSVFNLPVRLLAKSELLYRARRPL
jgi:hypothetical protein